LEPRFADSNPTETINFKGNKNAQDAFLRRGSKSFGHDVVKFYGMLKNFSYYDRNTTSAKFKDISPKFHASLLDVSGKTREHWWINQK
jgi:hypothetical protein